MDITEVRMVLTEPEGSHDHQRAVASVVFDNCFAVHGVRVLEGQNGCFVSMPARKGSDGKYHDVAHPITAEASQLVRGAVLREYERLVWERDPDKEPGPEAAAAGARSAPPARRGAAREAPQPER